MAVFGLGGLVGATRQQFGSPLQTHPGMTEDRALASSPLKGNFLSGLLSWVAKSTSCLHQCVTLHHPLHGTPLPRQGRMEYIG